MGVDWVSSETIRVLYLLLPGFLAAGVFHSLISNPKPSGIEIVVRAFIFTVIIQVVTASVIWVFDILEWKIPKYEKLGIILDVILSIILGLFSAFIWNNDLFHKFLRYLNITRQSSYQSARYSAFAFHRNCFVVLHMRGERRLYGWPREWPSRPDEQHFLVEDCEWLDDGERKPIEGVSHILVPSSEVEMIEFLPANPDREDTV